ncbi:MAG: ZIP family metal transporter [Euryarchaeota archaeon]|nr:ZIP family metal transporter [Euryarchaeota archaeon]
MLDPQATILVIIAGMATSLGAALVFLISKITHRLYDGLTGFSAGIMLAVTAFNLIPGALGKNQENIFQVLIGISAGAAALFPFERYTPHIHETLEIKKPLTPSMKTSLMIIVALTIHNFPEGFATGTAYSQGITAFGHSVALAIALQNIPEGLMVAVLMRAEGYSKKTGFIAGTLSGAVEPVCSILALIIVGLFSALLPSALAFAGGAMLYVIFDEMAPESHGHGYEREATFGFMLGFLLMTALNYIVAALSA